MGAEKALYKFCFVLFVLTIFHTFFGIQIKAKHMAKFVGYGFRVLLENVGSFQV